MLEHAWAYVEEIAFGSDFSSSEQYFSKFDCVESSKTMICGEMTVTPKMFIVLFYRVPDISKPMCGDDEIILRLIHVAK